MEGNEELVDHYIDRAAFSSDTDFAVKELKRYIDAQDAVVAKYKEVNDIKGTISAGKSLKDISGANTLGIKENAQFAQSIKSVIDIINQRFASEAKLKTTQTDYFRETLKNKLITAELTKELKLQAAVDLAAGSSIQKATALRAKMYFEQTRLNLATKEGAERSEILKGRIDSLSDFIKKNSDALTAQKINIGNYGPAVKDALSVIDKEIANINSKLSQTSKGGAGFELLSRQALLLQSISISLGKSFGTTSQEARALQEAAKKVGTEFGVSSEIFQKFSDKVGERKDELKDIQNALNFKASDTKYIDGVLQGLQAITGAYGAYQAIVAITGSENDALAKSMQKLQAVLTLVTSVQAVVNALQSDSALIQGGLAAKTALWAAAQRLAAFATGQTAAALTAETVAAEAASIAVGEAAAANATEAAAAGAAAATTGAAATAMAAEATAAGGLAAGLEGVAVAEASVATGASTMATAIAATGIGLLLIGIAAGVYLIVDALIDWNKGNRSIDKANEELARSTLRLIEVTKKYDEILRDATNRQLKDLDRLIEKRKSIGLTQLQSMALDFQSLKVKSKIADQEVKDNKVTEESIKAKNKAAVDAAKTLLTAEKLRLEYVNKTTVDKDPNFSETLDAYDKRIKLFQESSDAAAAVYQREVDILNNSLEAKQKLELAALEASKLVADERRSYILESARISADVQTAINDRVLNDERSNLTERLAALNNNLQQQKAVIAAENAAIQSDPSVSASAKATAQNRANADTFIAIKESEEAIYELKEDFRLRDLDAFTDLQKRVLSAVIDTNEKILENDAITEQRRLEALENSISARAELINAGFEQQLSEAGISDANIERIKKEGFFEIENKKITNKELLKIIGDYNADLVELAKDSNQKRIAIVKDYYQQEADLRDKALRDIQRSNELAVEDIADTGNNQTIALNEQFRNREIGQKEYNERRLKIEADLSKRLLLIELDRVEKALAATVTARETEKRLKKEIEDLKNFTGPQTDDQKKVNADRIKVLDDELKKVQEVVGKESELYKQLSALRKQISDADTKTFTDNQLKIIEGLNKFKNAVTEVFSVITGALNAIATQQKNILADQSEEIDRRTAADIERINATQQSEEKKAAQIIIVNARAQAEKEKIAQRQRKIDQEQARTQKVFAIFQIALSTAVNIARAYTPIEKIFAAISGAAQLAVAIATPIPRFKHGKGAGNNYEGMAVLDDGGRNEPHLRASTGKIEMSTGPARDRLTWVDRNDIIFPSLDAMLNHFSTPKVGSPRVAAGGGNDMARMMDKQTALLEKIASKKVFIQSATDKGMSNIWLWGSNRIKYIEDQTNW